MPCIDVCGFITRTRQPNRKEFWAKKSVDDSAFWGKGIFNQIHMKYILYARKSTEEADRQVLSIEAQIFELKEFAANLSAFGGNHILPACGRQGRAKEIFS